MQGTEKIPEVTAFKNEYRGTWRLELLKYIYFVYCRDEKNPYRNLLPSEAKNFVIDVNELFDRKKSSEKDYWRTIEEMPAVKPLIDKYLLLTYTPSEKQRFVYLQKIEKYMAILADPDSSPDQEKEADDMLKIFNKRLEEIDVQIAKEKESEDPSAGSMHLFELPSKVESFYRKIGMN